MDTTSKPTWQRRSTILTVSSIAGLAIAVLYVWTAYRLNHVLSPLPEVKPYQWVLGFSVVAVVAAAFIAIVYATIVALASRRRRRRQVGE